MPKSENTRTENLLLRAGLIRTAFRSDAWELYKIAREERLDALVCMTAPGDDALIAYAAHLPMPVILYQLDPYYSMNDVESLWLKRLFLRILPAFRHVFTTDLLMREYREDPALSKHLGKFSVLPFPKLIRPAESETDKNERITLLYAGSLYHTVRSPNILVRLRELLPESCELRFCGSCDNAEDFDNLKNSGVLCLGYCGQDVVRREIERADILINIGNAVKNQMGSKIVDYIATGKPILNITQLKDCSTRAILKEYDFSFHLEAENMRPSPELLAFVKQAPGKRMNWQTIESRWREYTPAYAAEQIQNALL